MLEKKVFLAGLKEIGNVFINFKLNNEQAEAWYRRFSKYNNNQYKKMIGLFLERSDFVPQSPHNITKYYEEVLKTEIKSLYPTPDEAWAIVIQGIRSHGLSYGYDKFYDYVMTHGGDAVLNVAKNYIRDLQQLQVGDTFTANAFKKSYVEELNKRTYEKEKEVLKLDGSTTKYLSNGE